MADGMVGDYWNGTQQGRLGYQNLVHVFNDWVDAGRPSTAAEAHRTNWPSAQDLIEWDHAGARCDPRHHEHETRQERFDAHVNQVIEVLQTLDPRADFQALVNVVAEHDAAIAQQAIDQQQVTIPDPNLRMGSPIDAQRDLWDAGDSIGTHTGNVFGAVAYGIASVVTNDPATQRAAAEFGANVGNVIGGYAEFVGLEVPGPSNLAAHVPPPEPPVPPVAGDHSTMEPQAPVPPPDPGGWHHGR